RLPTSTYLSRNPFTKSPHLPLLPLQTHSSNLNNSFKMTSPTNWKEEAKRWKHRVDILTATDQDLTDYICFKLWEYSEHKAMDDVIWSFFQDDFEHFHVNTFSRIHAKHLRSMYTFLRRGGVYVRTKD